MVQDDTRILTQAGDDGRDIAAVVAGGPHPFGSATPRAEGVLQMFENPEAVLSRAVERQRRAGQQVDRLLDGGGLEDCEGHEVPLRAASAAVGEPTSSGGRTG